VIQLCYINVWGTEQTCPGEGPEVPGAGEQLSHVIFLTIPRSGYSNHGWFEQDMLVHGYPISAIRSTADVQTCFSYRYPQVLSFAYDSSTGQVLGDAKHWNGMIY